MQKPLKQVANAVYGPTAREVVILRLISRGFNLPMVAQEMDIPYETLRTQIAVLCRRYNVRGPIQLLRLAYESGWLVQTEEDREKYRSLSKRQREVAALVIMGHKNVAIARRLGIKPTSVKTHLAHIAQRTRTRSRHGLVAIALDLQLEAQTHDEVLPPTPEVSDTVTSAEQAAYQRLTTRELAIVELRVKGYKVISIAARLQITPSTVHQYLSGAYRKLGTYNPQRLDLILRACAEDMTSGL